MSIELKPGCHYVAFWYVPAGVDVSSPLPGGKSPCDWFAALWFENGSFHTKYRFRYYHSDIPFDPQDVGSWYGGHGATDRDKCVSGLDLCMLVHAR